MPVLVAGSVLLATAASAAVIGAGKVAPAWSGKTVEGKPLKSTDLKGKVVLLNFFSYYCTACRKEYPHLQALQKKHAARGFTVVSVSSDEDPKEAGAFAKEVKATFPVVQDPAYAIFEKFGVEPMPTNIVIDRQGKVVASIEGLDLKALDAAVAKALALR